ncbi:hydrogen-transporting atp synthase [Stylonychia lemnae]|uniref:Hydrogen-transporting atp synthase n=1 Tax=Stylonychia lemnae TaxID=5949 RepID=A0A078B114_STYLE|nr:hydrogen-transporting atp synthase [Stylonychia lemnae]|eukprot:CDW86778.1 hydrogen-transporting atp synthase [Stylonychia lemnae]
MGKKEDGLWQGTLIFITIFVFGAAILGQYVYSVTKERSQARDNRLMTFGLVFMGTFCMWILWICTYMHQMYPLVKPELV